MRLDCAVPENIHTPPTEGIGISGCGGLCKAKKNLKKCIKLNWNFQRGGGLLKKKSLTLGRYGYFLELHMYLLTVSNDPQQIKYIFSFFKASTNIGRVCLVLVPTPN